MKNTSPVRIKTISAYHQLRGLAKPEHPLISVIHLDELDHQSVTATSWVFEFYSIALKRNFEPGIKYKYGQQTYDFDEGVMFFIAPNQVFSVKTTADYKLSGWMLLVHPDYLFQTALSKTISAYEYFNYSANEALHLSEKEEITITDIFKSIRLEYHANIDRFSQPVITSQIALLLHYADRFYHRQFITRKQGSHRLLTKLEELLNEYFSDENFSKNGLPNVADIAAALAVSPNYLSSLLKSLTGQSTQQHIQEKLIGKAKEQLSTTDLSISEIAYGLGFEHPQSFSKMFKAKTRFSPLEFRESFN